MNVEKTRQLISQIPDNVKLIAVTKMQTLDDVEQLLELGVVNCGENKIQELLKKKEQFPNVNWHFIGRIQSNKIKQMVNNCVMIHSVSTLRHLQTINKEAAKIGKVQEILIQFNLAEEPTKAGFTNDEFNKLKSEYSLYPNVNIRGIMVIGDHTDNTSQIEATFSEANNLYTELQTIFPNVDTLSMGMSSDYQLAIAHNSNMIRLGTILFAD